jgi:hypothetical protein
MANAVSRLLGLEQSYRDQRADLRQLFEEKAYHGSRGFQDYTEQDSDIRVVRNPPNRRRSPAPTDARWPRWRRPVGRSRGVAVAGEMLRVGADAYDQAIAGVPPIAAEAELQAGSRSGQSERALKSLAVLIPAVLNVASQQCPPS